MLKMLRIFLYSPNLAQISVQQSPECLKNKFLDLTLSFTKKKKKMQTHVSHYNLITQHLFKVSHFCTPNKFKVALKNKDLILISNT